MAPPSSAPPPSGALPRFAYLTPRTLPPADRLAGRVAVLDVAFASEGGGSSFEKTTLPFINGLGARLAAWVDHHDHERHADYRGDARFVLCTKAEHGACPEMITPDVVRAAGPVDTVAVHLDLDGIYSGAKWVLGGVEPYDGADADARAVDTRRGQPGPIATRIDRALRARFRDETLKHRIVQYLVARAKAPVLWEEIELAAREIDPLLDESKRLSERYELREGVAYVEAQGRPYDKTELLLLGQERAPVAVVRDSGSLTIAADFESGFDFVKMLQLGGGMPTRVTVPEARHVEVMTKLAAETARRAAERAPVRGRCKVPPDMAARRPLVSQTTARHGALAARVLSAAGGMTAGLASEGPLPSRRDIKVLVEELLEVLFPESHRMGSVGPAGGELRDYVADTIASLEEHLAQAIYLGLHRLCAKREANRDKCERRSRALTQRLLDALPDIRARLAKDVLAAYDSDPAATGLDEIVACYPGLYAIAVYRVAHHLLHLGAEVLPRMLTEHAHSRTGIDIHPGATIGDSFFIDHGTGIVVGETSTIGNRVRIYQGVTLGALSIKDRGRIDQPTKAVPPARAKPGAKVPTKKRHPTIEDDAIIYANATILGGNTVIGQGAVVGGNAWITYSVPPRTRVGVGT